MSKKFWKSYFCKKQKQWYQNKLRGYWSHPYLWLWVLFVVGAPHLTLWVMTIGAFLLGELLAGLLGICSIIFHIWVVYALWNGNHPWKG